MIAQISGTLIRKDSRFVVVDVHGIGYKIFASEETLLRLPPLGVDIVLHTYQHIREDSNDLYGFLSFDELEFFELLLSISGVGPKAGMNILSKATPEEIQRAVLANDVSILTKISGIGKKTAERIVVELKGKIKDFAITEISTGRNIVDDKDDAMSALIALGCSENEAREALRALPSTIVKIEDQIKEALKFMGSRT